MTGRVAIIVVALAGGIAHADGPVDKVLGAMEKHYSTHTVWAWKYEVTATRAGSQYGVKASGMAETGDNTAVWATCGWTGQVCNIGVGVKWDGTYEWSADVSSHTVTRTKANAVLDTARLFVSPSELAKAFTLTAMESGGTTLLELVPIEANPDLTSAAYTVNTNGVVVGATIIDGAGGTHAFTFTEERGTSKFVTFNHEAIGRGGGAQIELPVDETTLTRTTTSRRQPPRRHHE